LRQEKGSRRWRKTVNLRRFRGRRGSRWCSSLSAAVETRWPLGDSTERIDTLRCWSLVLRIPGLSEPVCKIQFSTICVLV